MVQLTTNFLTDLIHAPENAEIFESQPVVQFLSVKPVDPTQAGTPQERYRVIISDGTNYLQSMMATQLNHFIHEQAVIKHSLVKLTRFTLSTVRDKRLTIILGLEVLEKTHEKIGDPTPIETPSAVNTGAVNTPQPVAAASNSKTNSHPVEQNSSKPQPTRPSRPTYPIESLSPYQNNWTIKARVTQKSEVKRWSNQKGEGQLFSVTLMDETGEIRATGFNAVVDELFNKFQEGKVYYVSKGRVNLAKKKFNSVANDYEISLEKTTEVEECRDTAGLPQVKYNFAELGDLGNFEKDATCDVIAIVKEVGQLGDITTKQGKTLHKRELTMVDRSAVQTRLTLWGKQAEDWNRFDHPVVAFKGVKIGDFGGRSLSMLSSSTMTLEPDIVEAHGLRGWYDAMGANTTFTSQGGGGGGGGGTSGPIRREDFRTLTDVKESDLGGGEKPDYFTARGTVVHIKPEPVSYPGCKSCNKKVQPSQSGDGWRCEKCDLVMAEPEYRYMLAFAVADYSGQAWLQSFNDSATTIMGMPANQLNQYKESDEAQFNAAMHHASFATYDFVCRAKQDTYNDQTRVRYAISRMQPLDYKEEAKHLVELLRSPWAS